MAVSLLLIEPGIYSWQLTAQDGSELVRGEQKITAEKRSLEFTLPSRTPCRLISRDLATGDVRLLARRAGLATAASDAGILAFEDYARPGTLALTRLSGAALGAVPLPAGMRLVPAESRALAGIDQLAGMVVLAPAGRPEATVPPSFVDVTARRLVSAGEGVR